MLRRAKPVEYQAPLAPSSARPSQIGVTSRLFSLPASEILGEARPGTGEAHTLCAG